MISPGDPGTRAIDMMMETIAPPQPFADLCDNHEPFRLTRVRPRWRRPLWHWAVLGFVLFCYGLGLWAVLQ